jgi:hypothetical protein
MDPHWNLPSSVVTNPCQSSTSQYHCNPFLTNIYYVGNFIQEGIMKMGLAIILLLL